MTPTSEPTEPQGGWALVVVLALCQLVSWGSIYYGFALFVAPMEAELGWSRSSINGALSVGLVVSGGCAYAMGRWIDRRGGHALMTAGSAAAGVLLLVWSALDDLMLFYLVWIAMGIAMAAMLYQALFAVLTRTFHVTYRARITVVTLFGGLASTVFIPLTQVLIEEFGWRQALVVLAALQLLVCLPVHGFGLRDRAGAGRSGAGGLPSAGAVGHAVRSRVFWFLALCFVATSMINAIFSFHMVPILVERGFAMINVVGAIAVMGPSQVVGRLLLFGLGRRVSPVTAGRIALGLQPVAVLVLALLPTSLAGIYAFAILYGLVNGTMTIVRATAIPDLLGRAGYGAISGLLALPPTAVHAATPLVAALVWARFGGYDVVVWSMVVAAFIAVFAFSAAAWASHVARQRTPT